LGGEWGGAVLLATENAPPGKKAWFGMFPQLGAPLGFILSNGSFILLSNYMSNDEFLAWGWRIPFLASALLVFVGLYVRLNIEETPDFRKVLESREQVKVPMLTVFTKHTRMLILGSLAAREVFVSTLSVTTASESEEALPERLQALEHSDGTKVYNPATVGALLVFFVYALQCLSTIAVLYRESNSWKWPALAMGSMFALAYGAAFLTHTIIAAVT
jgi:Fe2+ transport system protein B